jgi:kynurenine 3-monooxygenase
VQEDRRAALESYSRLRFPDARALVQASHRADQGFLFFVLPIIMDMTFYKFAPWLFQTSTFRLMQFGFIRFSAVQFRKRIDRVLQVLVLGALATLVAKVAWKVVALAMQALRMLSTKAFV